MCVCGADVGSDGFERFSGVIKPFHSLIEGN